MENFTPVITIGIIVVTSIVTFLGFNNIHVFESLKFDIRSIVKEKEIYKIFTSGLLHVNMVHLLFNMFSFYSFARHMERTYGGETILLIYCISLFGGSILAAVIQRKNMNYSAVGASGAVSGIIMASVFLIPGGSVYMFFIPIPIPAYIYALLFVLISIYGIHSQADSIGHEAHLGGAILGLLTTAVLYPEAVKHSPILFGVILGIVVLYFIIVTIKPFGFGIRGRD